MQYTWEGTHTSERGEVGVLVWCILSPVHLTTASAAFPGKIPKAAAILTSKDQATSVILRKGEGLSIQGPTEYLFFNLRLLLLL